MTAIFQCDPLCSNARYACMEVTKIVTETTIPVDPRTRFPRLRYLRPFGSGGARKPVRLVAVRCRGLTRRTRSTESRMTERVRRGMAKGRREAGVAEGV